MSRRINSIGKLRLFAVSITVLAFLLNACRGQNSATKPFTADIFVSSTVMPGMSGKLYLSGNHMRLDWGNMVDVFDLKTRQGWRTFPESKMYMVLESRKLSTYAPEMVGGTTKGASAMLSVSNLLCDHQAGALRPQVSSHTAMRKGRTAALRGPA